MASSYKGNSSVFISLASFLIIWSGLSAANASSTSKLFKSFIASQDANSGTISENETGSNGTRWAVLVAGSNGWINYRHQADLCHAYQVLKRGGLKDENIVVFMYDDIAHNVNNPKPGVIINKPNGQDVYQGVPKDYTGENVTTNNLYAVILGNKTALTGGSGKVVDSGPNDHIFIYYTDHGGPGILAMPTNNGSTVDYIYADDLVRVLEEKHAANAYKSMVFYIEACEAGSIFEGLLPNNISIYATTASNANESSWAAYCPGDNSSYTEYSTCLGDLYSISWLEDCDVQDLRFETLEQQYDVVRNRTGKGDHGLSSHVMQYGDTNLDVELLSEYMGENPPNITQSSPIEDDSSAGPSLLVPQRDADLVHFLHKIHGAPTGSKEKIEAQKQLRDELAHRMYLHYSINKIGKALFGHENSSNVLKNLRPAGQSLVDDWDCLKILVSTYEKYCGSLSTYGLKYMRDFANMCNAGVTAEQMVAASIQACSS